MMKGKVAITVIMLTVLVGFSFAQSGSSIPHWHEDHARQVVDVSGTQMTLDGSAWMSRGVALQGFIRPLSKLQAEAASNQTAAQLLNARLNYGPAELEAIRAFHADTIRFQVSQPALDPKSPLYDANYFNDVSRAIKFARRAGFVVMIMMQDETITGDAKQAPLPTEQTQRDWDLFTPVFGCDRGVVFELYNEPGLNASASSWQLWLEGGRIPGRAQSFIGMQTLINHLRGNGAQNVFVLDGLGTEVENPSTKMRVREAAETLGGLPSVTDPLNRLVYAVHPYQHGIADESHWNADFGIPSMRVPVWADEWSAPTELPLGLGSLDSYQVAVDLLNYLRLHSISVCTGAFDVPRFVVQDIPGWRLTNYRDYSSASLAEGSGMLVHRDFAAHYTRQLSDADGQ